MAQQPLFDLHRDVRPVEQRTAAGRYLANGNGEGDEDFVLEHSPDGEMDTSDLEAV